MSSDDLLVLDDIDIAKHSIYVKHLYIIYINMIILMDRGT